MFVDMSTPVTHVLPLRFPLHCRYQLVEAEDGQWGEVLPSGRVTGMIGVVARREADFAVNEITVTGIHAARHHAAPSCCL